MAIQKDRALRQDQRLHRKGVGRRNAHGDKPLPGAARHGCPSPDVVKRALWQVQHRLHRGGPDVGLKERRGMGNNGNPGAVFAAQRRLRLAACGQQIGRCHELRRKNPVQGFQRELPPAVQKIGNMRLSKPCLAGQQGDAHRSPLYPAQQFQAEPFVHLSEVHVWKIRHQLCGRYPRVFLQKSQYGRFSFIFRVPEKNEQPCSGKALAWIDAEDTHLYIGFTQSRSACGNYWGIRFLAKGLNQG